MTQNNAVAEAIQQQPLITVVDSKEERTTTINTDNSNPEERISLLAGCTSHTKSPRQKQKNYSSTIRSPKQKCYSPNNNLNSNTPSIDITHNDVLIPPKRLFSTTSDITFDTILGVENINSTTNEEFSILKDTSRNVKIHKEYSAITTSSTSSSFIPGVSGFNNDNKDNSNNWLGKFSSSFWTRCCTTTTTTTTTIGSHNNKVIIFFKKLQKFCSFKNLQVILVGSTVYALYNLVFCLAMASSITAPHRTRVTMLGPIAKLCTMGVVTGAPLLLLGLSSDHPALYPVFDLFLAPFLADIATTVDNTLYEQSLRDTTTSSTSEDKYSDSAFLTTYVFILSIGLLLTALGTILGFHVKLANIGEYLPYPVLCGFFSTVGVTLWTLAIAVDTGMSIQHIISSKSWDLVQYSLYHHIPSALMGILMYIFGPSNKLFVIVMVFTAIISSYVVMLLFHIPLERAQKNNWFWKGEDLMVKSVVEGSETHLEPYEPFGVMYGALFSNYVNYEAVLNAVPHLIAMSLVYTLRMYLFASAFRKSATEAWDYIYQKETEALTSTSSVHLGSVNGKELHHRRRSSVGTTQAGVQEEISLFQLLDDPSNNKMFGYDVKRIPPPRNSKTLSWCSAELMLLAAVGTAGPVLPGLGISPSLQKIGVEGLAPQFASIILMAYFYATDMSMIAFIPKIAFSCLLVLSSINILNSWFLTSYSKIRQKEEWLVVPLIIAFYFMFDMLRAVALGVALSTFIFVASFYRTGTVKLMSNGSIIRSTVARTTKDAEWLNRNGDLIQVLVLQNYLFFGNASSCLNCIEKMFEEVSAKDKEQSNCAIPRIPKYLIIDLSLVTGIDASTADVFSEALSMCKSNSCCFFIVGVSSSIKSALACGGFKPGSPDRYFRFISNLESAIGRAEDGLLTDIFKAEEMDRKSSVARRRIRLMSLGSDSGFGYALEQIDQQHALNFTPHLLGLEKYTDLVEIEVGQCLYRSYGGVVGDNNRGLFFIETGLLRVERDPDHCSSSLYLKDTGGARQNLGQPFLRASELSSESRIPQSKQSKKKSTKFRLARIGPGFIVGGVEMSTGLRDPGIHLAVTKCRLHHLPYSKMAEIEQTEPLLMLNLYKLLAYLIAYREQQAIEQLTTMYSIVGAVPNFKLTNCTV